MATKAKSPKDDKLTEKQEEFVRSYFETGNAILNEAHQSQAMGFRLEACEAVALAERLSA